MVAQLPAADYVELKATLEARAKTMADEKASSPTMSAWAWP